jgi:hypothetical protein
MLAVAGAVLGIIAAILKLVNQHENWIIWLLIVAVILVCVDVAWGWRRGGYYHRGAA